MNCNAYLIGYRYCGSNYIQAVVIAQSENAAKDYIKGNYNNPDKLQFSTFITLKEGTVWIPF